MIGAAAAALTLAGFGGASTGESSDDAAANFPERSVEFIVPFAPGGSTDLIGRAATKAIKEPLGQSMVVVNKEGAGGAVGTKEAVTGKADGYKLALAPTALFTITPVVKQEPTGLDLDDMKIVTGLTRENIVLVVHKDSPYKTVDDLINDKNRTKPLTYGHSGVGGASHFAGKVFLEGSGVRAEDVPFDGNGPTVNALLGKQIDVAATQIAESIKQVQAGDLRQLVVFSDERLDTLKDIPTAKEKGVDVTVDQVRFVAAPKETPDAVVDKLRDAFLKSTQDPAYDKSLENLFIERAALSGGRDPHQGERGQRDVLRAAAGHRFRR